MRVRGGGDIINRWDRDRIGIFLSDLSSHPLISQYFKRPLRPTMFIITTNPYLFLYICLSLLYFLNTLIRCYPSSLHLFVAAGSCSVASAKTPPSAEVGSSSASSCSRSTRSRRC